MPPVAALAVGAASVAASVAAPIIAGAASIAGAAASAVGSVASGILGGATGLAGGAVSTVGGIAGGLLGGGGQAAVAVTPGMEMGQLAAASALGVPAATGGIASGLSTIFSGVQAGVGIYGQLAQIEMAKEMTEAQKIAAQTGLMQAEAVKLYAAAPAAPAPAPVAPTAAIPTLSAQPVYVTPPAAAAAPNYLLYIGLAALAFFLLRKK